MRGRKRTWWLSTFGRVEACERDLSCPEGHGHDRPFQRLSGVACRSKSAALQKALTDFGAEKSFAQASQQLREHYGVHLDSSSVRQVVARQGQGAEQFVPTCRDRRGLSALTKAGPDIGRGRSG